MQYSEGEFRIRRGGLQVPDVFTPWSSVREVWHIYEGEVVVERGEGMDPPRYTLQFEDDERAGAVYEDIIRTMGGEL